MIFSYRYFLILLFLGLTNLYAQHEASEKNDGFPSENYTNLTFNGAWCWFSDPRAIYYEGIHKRTYSGWVDNYGNVYVGYYDHETNLSDVHLIFENIGIDDHNSPSLTFDSNGRLYVFFNKHSVTDAPLYFLRAKVSESISTWEPVKHLRLNTHDEDFDGINNYTYTNPIFLSSENERLFLFWRGTNNQPCFAYSDDYGNTWSDGKIFFYTENNRENIQRPYLKVFSKGDHTIHFTLTDGHPKNIKNNIYYFYYKDNAFYKANGKKIKNITEGPVYPEEVDVVYSASSNNTNAWNWDIAENKEGNPVITFVNFPSKDTHIYTYAIWHNNEWLVHDIINSGASFVTSRSNSFLEPYYSGGISIDHETPNKVYASINRNGIFEIEEWMTSDYGKSWKNTPITKNSAKNNIRPFAVRGAEKGTPLQVLWMFVDTYHYYSDEVTKTAENSFADRFHTAIKTNLLNKKPSAIINKTSLNNTLYKIANWQLNNPVLGTNDLNQHYGVFYTGLTNYSTIAYSKAFQYELTNRVKKNFWKKEETLFQPYINLGITNWSWLRLFYKNYTQFKKIETIEVEKLFQYYKKVTDDRFSKKQITLDWWLWSDTFFIPPPKYSEITSFGISNDYLNYLFSKWENTTTNAHKEHSTLLPLTKLLSFFPKSHEKRIILENQFKRVINNVLMNSTKEESHKQPLLTTVQLTYALAYGIAQDLIDEKYISVVLDYWKHIKQYISSSGAIHYEGITTKEHVKIAGYYLLAGTAIHNIINNQ